MEAVRQGNNLLPYALNIHIPEHAIFFYSKWDRNRHDRMVVEITSTYYC